MLSYNRANRAVAVLCNHQRAVPKSHDTSMANLQAKIDKKMEEVEKAEKEYKTAKKNKASDVEKRKAALKRLLEQLDRLETQKTDREENKQIALGTSKLNYLDPRISVAWCKKYDVPIEKVYNKTQKDKFRWAIEMTEDDYQF
jgi:DNA topoisomerase-1